MIIKKKRFAKVFLLLLVNVFMLANTLEAQEQLLTSITVESGNQSFYNTPVSAVLPDTADNYLENGIALVETTAGKQKRIPFQVEPGMQYRIWWILDGKTPMNSARYYELRTVKSSEEFERSMHFELDQKSLTLQQDGKNVMNYHYAIKPAPADIDPKYARGGFIHPLYSPAGNVLTRIQPPDHYHHYGIWNPWTKTHFDGREIDFWNLVKGQGTVQPKGFASKVSGPVYTGFKVLHDHVDLIGDTTALNELWDVRVFKYNYHGKEAFLCDFTTTLNCATGKQVELVKYRYGGGIGFRATEAWHKNNTRVLTSEGKTRPEADATRARWCTVWGDFPGKISSGILFMSHPSNHEHPEPMRVWPLDAAGGRGDMFFQFCPIRHSSWMIKPGNLYTLKYRMFIFDGEFLSKDEAEALWNEFAQPPEVMIGLDKQQHLMHKKIKNKNNEKAIIKSSKINK